MMTKRHLLLLVFWWANADCAVAGTDKAFRRYLSLPLGSKGVLTPFWLALGAWATDARRIAANSRRWWHNSRFVLNRVMPIAYFDRLGLPRLS